MSRFRGPAFKGAMPERGHPAGTTAPLAASGGKEPAMTGPQTPAPAAQVSQPAPPQPGRDRTPAGGAPSESSAPPAGTSGDEERAAQRKQWARLTAAHGRGQRGGPYRRRAVRGTLPGPGMIRRPPPDGAA